MPVSLPSLSDHPAWMPMRVPLLAELAARVGEVFRRKRTMAKLYMQCYCICALSLADIVASVFRWINWKAASSTA